MIILHYNYGGEVPQSVSSELLDLTAYIMREFDAYLSHIDAFYFWTAVSQDIFDVPWVPIEVRNYDLNDKLFLLECLKRYCTH